MSPPTNFAIELARARRDAFRRRLEGMTSGQQTDLVDKARNEIRWPNRQWIEDHRAEKMPYLSIREYVELAQSVKRRPGTRVYAFVHVVHGNEGFAFINPEARILVWFHLDNERNMSCFTLEETADEFISDRGDLYWRLPDTERR